MAVNLFFFIIFLNFGSVTFIYDFCLVSFSFCLIFFSFLLTNFLNPYFSSFIHFHFLFLFLFLLSSSSLNFIIAISKIIIHLKKKNLKILLTEKLSFEHKKKKFVTLSGLLSFFVESQEELKNELLANIWRETKFHRSEAKHFPKYQINTCENFITSIILHCYGGIFGLEISLASPTITPHLRRTFPRSFFFLFVKIIACM